MDIDVHTSGLRLGRAFVALILGTLLVAGCGSDTLGEHAECAEGATREMSCGSFGNGTLTQICVDFRWKDDGFCEDSNECAPGTVRPIVCGINEKGEGSEECTNGVWTVLEACIDPDACENGLSREVTCGVQDAGLQEEICTSGQWAAFGDCINDLDCELDEIDRQACGHNMRGVKERSCVDFRWEDDFGLCVDPDECLDEDQQEARCTGQLGINGQELVKYRECINGQWGDYGTCVDADECLNGTEGLVACGDDGLGLQNRFCENGGWSFAEHCHQTIAEILPAPYGLLLVDNEAQPKAIGSNARRALGVAGLDEEFAALPIESAGPSPFRSEETHRRFAASSTHQCAISSADELYCWGDNTSRQLGPNGGAAPEITEPVLVPLNGTPETVVVGEGFSCVLSSAGRVYCWGRNDEGQRGSIDSLSPSPQPVELQMSSIRYLAAGDAHACAGNGAGDVFCWGRNTSHQVSPSPSSSLGAPEKHEELSEHPNDGFRTSLLGLYAGANHTLALWSKEGASNVIPIPPNTSLIGVGANDRGQLGSSLTENGISSPTVLLSLARHLLDDRGVQVHASGDVTCTFEPQASRVRCTGDNRFGQISDSSSESIAELTVAPADLTSFDDAIQSLAVQNDAICVLLSQSHRIACRGGNTYGQLGDGTTISRPVSDFVLHPSPGD